MPATKSAAAPASFTSLICAVLALTGNFTGSFGAVVTLVKTAAEAMQGHVKVAAYCHFEVGHTVSMLLRIHSESRCEGAIEITLDTRSGEVIELRAFRGKSEIDAPADQQNAMCRAFVANLPRVAGWTDRPVRVAA